MIEAYVEGRPIPRSSSSLTNEASLYRAGGLVAWPSAVSSVAVNLSPTLNGGKTAVSSSSETSSLTSSLPSISVDQFFQYYQDLFFQIPKFGDINSHEYLIKTSQEYAGDFSNDDTIQALIDEITELRKENLELQQQQLPINNV